MQDSEVDWNTQVINIVFHTWRMRFDLKVLLVIKKNIRLPHTLMTVIPSNSSGSHDSRLLVQNYWTTKKVRFRIQSCYSTWFLKTAGKVTFRKTKTVKIQNFTDSKSLYLSETWNQGHSLLASQRKWVTFLCLLSGSDLDRINVKIPA